MKDRGINNNTMDILQFGDITEVGVYEGLKPREYDLVLCKITEDPIAELNQNISNFKLEKSVAGVDSISFSVPKLIGKANGKMGPNPIYDLIEGNRLVLLNDEQYFILSKPVIKHSSDNVVIKEIIGYSREYELTQKLIDHYEGLSRVLYDYNNTIDENGVELGFLNYVENKTSWRVGYVDPQINKKYRMLNISPTNLYRSFEDVQKAFGCVFRFDTIDKLINVYKPTEIGTNQGVYLSDANFVNNIMQEINDENIVTRLYLYGSDNISVQGLTMMGQPYIEDFSFFKREKYMSKGLIDGLNKQKDKQQELQPAFENNREKRKQLQKDLDDLQLKLRDQWAAINILEHEWDLLIAEGKSAAAKKREIEAAQQEAQKLRRDETEILNKIRDNNNELSRIREQVRTHLFLNNDQIKELDYFIKEERYFDTSYTEENIDELLEDGLEMLSKISKADISFNVDVDDFLTMIRGHFIWNRFSLGDIITLHHEDVGFDYEVRLIGYTHMPENNRLTLSFSSLDNIYEDKIYLEKLLEDAANASSAIDFNKYMWDKGAAVDSKFSKYIESSLDLSNQALTKADGQKPILDDRGLWLYREDSNGNPMPEQIRAINNVIAITKDNWETVEWALTPDGIMANQLVGNVILGTDLKILSDSGVVEILNNVINIKDDRGRLRVALGEYQPGKYGLRIKDKDGKNTVLDENGMLQVWQEGRTDNVDRGNPLKLHVYIPDNTRTIFSGLVRVNRLDFRSYSRSASSETIQLTTTESDGSFTTTSGPSSISKTTSEDSGMYIYTDTDLTELGTQSTQSADDDIHWGSHNHGITNNTTFFDVNGYRHTFHQSGAHSHGPHGHSLYLPQHDHEVDIDHTHTIQGKSHSHDIRMPSHRHDIEPSIYEKASNVYYRIRVNGSLESVQWRPRDASNINITSFLRKGQWNTVEIEADSLGRIDASVFVQCMLNFDGID